MNSSDQLVLAHKWEESVGRPPYRYLGGFSFPNPALAEHNVTAYNAALRKLGQLQRHFGVSGGVCDVCGMVLMHNFVCQNADGQNFVVGGDCVHKHGDHKLVTAVEKAGKERAREARRLKREEKHRLAWERREATLEAERQCNGGLTDWEVKEKARKDAIAEAGRLACKHFAPIVAALEGASGSGYFAKDVLDGLRRGSLPTGRGMTITCDIYARTKGRRNSKAYNAAFEEAEALFDTWEVKA